MGGTVPGGFWPPTAPRDQNRGTREVHKPQPSPWCRGSSSIPQEGGSGAGDSDTRPCIKKGTYLPREEFVPHGPGSGLGGLGGPGREGREGREELCGAGRSRAGSGVREEASLRYRGGTRGSSRVAHPGNPSTEMGQGGRRCLWERQPLRRRLRTGIPPPLRAPGAITPSSRDGSASQGTALGSQLQIPLPAPGGAAPHRPHLMRIPVGRASSSLAFLRFLSASSEDLGQSRVSSTATAPQHH